MTPRRENGNAANKRVRKTPSGETFVPRWQHATEAEPRWPAFSATVVVILGQTWVAGNLRVRPVWVYPLVASLLLVSSLAIYVPARKEPPRALRILSLVLVGVLVVASFAGLVLLLRGVFTSSGLSPGRLFLTGIALWVVNIAVFALLFWELDCGGPEARAKGDPVYPDLVFPQQQQDQEGLASPDWKPTFPDYLFVSLNAATAFSPTDTFPYSRRAKLVMGVESIMSLATIAMLVARAINKAGG